MLFGITRYTVKSSGERSVEWRARILASRGIEATEEALHTLIVRRDLAFGTELAHPESREPPARQAGASANRTDGERALTDEDRMQALQTSRAFTAPTN